MDYEEYMQPFLNGNVSSETAERVITHIASERPAWREGIQEYEAD